jgi:hypothetical protein
VWRKATRLNRQKAVVVRRPGTAEGPGSVRSGAGSSPPDAASGRGRHGGHPSAAAYCDLRRTRSFLSQSHEATKDGGRSLGLAASRPERRRWPAQGGLTLRGLDLTFLLDRCWSDGRRRSLGPAPATCFVSLWLRVEKWIGVWRRRRVLGQAAPPQVHVLEHVCRVVGCRFARELRTRLRPTAGTNLLSAACQNTLNCAQVEVG